MSEPLQTGTIPGSPSPAAEQEWRVRGARREDATAVAGGVRALLLELGGAPPDPQTMEDAAAALIDDPAAGAVLVVEAAGEVVGVLAASWQIAIHVPGSYLLIQDLWVHPDWRDRALGGALLAALFELGRSRGAERVEVGLPREHFQRFAATEAFYLGNGFTANGPRMRRILA